MAPWRVPASLLLLAALAFCEPPRAPVVAPVIPPAAQASAHFDAIAATNAWLATIPAAQRARSDAYTEGGEWLILWDFLYTLLVMLILLETKLSARMRDWAERGTRRHGIQTALYWIGFMAASAVLTFPLVIYEDFLREHQYGLSNQNFHSWLRDQFIGFGLTLLLGGLAFLAITAIVSRFPRTWHWWGGAVGVVFLVFSIVIGPVFIEPLFNTYTPLPASALKDRILSMARANGIAANDVYEVDESRQSKRVSANVSGLFGTERIALNDNLLNRCSPEGVMATMGHEMGHYVLHHLYNDVLFFGVVILAMFGVLRRALEWMLERWGARWELRGVSDVAALPAAVLILATLGFLFTPIGNTWTRTQEAEADIFGLNASRQPDGEAEVDLLLGEYRKLDPSPIEEMLFFDHPGGRTRIYAAMRWKAENLKPIPNGPIRPTERPLR
ncbi:MAG TPA: M48 family metallopeptidase [Bryobacteraceae bacterium]